MVGQGGKSVQIYGRDLIIGVGEIVSSVHINFLYSTVKTGVFAILYAINLMRGTGLLGVARFVLKSRSTVSSDLTDEM